MRLRPSERPTVVVVLPSPAGVGLMAVTRISLPSGRLLSESRKSKEILALVLPYGTSASAGTPSFAATSAIGFIFASRAISMSDLTVTGVPLVMRFSWRRLRGPGLRNGFGGLERLSREH